MKHTKTEVAHTPGPWMAAPWTSHAPTSILTLHREFIADCNRSSGNYTEIEANANLIAAAPDLLEACEAAVDELIGLRAYLTTCDFGVIRENIDGLAYKMNDVRAKIEAAIRKSKGE